MLVSQEERALSPVNVIAEIELSPGIWSTGEMKVSVSAELSAFRSTVTVSAIAGRGSEKLGFLLTTFRFNTELMGVLAGAYPSEASTTMGYCPASSQEIVVISIVIEKVSSEFEVVCKKEYASSPETEIEATLSPSGSTAAGEVYELD